VDVAYHPAAQAELRRTVRRYEQERAGLGLAFLTAVGESEAFVGAYPDAGAPLGVNRRQIVRRFPYTLIYRREEERVFILAVAHTRRRPDYWHNRR
jgi:toxin ParE1/3/4